jgi:hypothetical protein
MEHAGWMNEQVRGEIDDLQQRYGFEEDEAAAYWHLQLAGQLMNEMRSADLWQEMSRHEGQDDAAGQQQAILLDHTGRWHSRVGQHFAALNQELGRRVLRRTYPDGWGHSRTDATDDEA